jgi:hypothetical protein
MRLLGGQFEFNTDSPELLRIVNWAYARLPGHTLNGGRVPRFKISIHLAPPGEQPGRREPAQIAMMGADGLLCATTSTSDFVAVSPEQHSAVIVVSSDMLRSPYHVRYELIEFTVFMLASRVQKLVSLHAACVGRDGRGILLLGDSGAGKSTAALHTLLRGWDFLSEDSVLVEPESMVATGVANFLHVGRDALRFLSRSSTAALIRRSQTIRRRSGVTKYELDLRRPAFHLSKHPLQIAALIFLTPDAADGRPLMRTLARADALRRLEAGQPYAAHQAGWKAFARRALALPAFELRRGNHPAEAVEALAPLLPAAP